MGTNYLKRKIDDYLQEWKANADRKPLIVKGPRQIGKTESINHFGHENYKNVIYINFVEEPQYKTITDNGYKVENIINNISLIDPSRKFYENETLIIFDELQEFPEIATSLKFFNLDRRFDVICSGSLLGINYNRIESNSVGNKTDYTMSSLDFEEFLLAKGYDDKFINDILAHMTDVEPLSDTELAILSKLFFEYIILGGMPDVISSYIKRKTHENTLDIQHQILLDYREDVRKYAGGLDQARILNIFDNVSIQLSKENKKFQISKVKQGARFNDYRGCIEWLADSGIIQLCRCLHYPELPLKGNYKEDVFKVYMFDTGLFVASLDEEAQIDLRANKNYDVYKGALYENIVGEALVKQGYQLYYYKKENSTLEEDFFIRTADDLIPVEVKSTNSKAKSLVSLINGSQYPDIKYGIKLIKGNIGFNNNIYTFPLSCSFLLKRYLQEKNNQCNMPSFKGSSF